MPSPAEILDRLPPQNLDAEKALLGSILLLPAVLDEVGSVVKTADFYADANRKLFGHLMAMHDAGRRFDVTLLKARLQQHGDWEAVGGGAYLSDVAASVPTAAHAIYYARLVASAARLRALIHAATEILRDAYNAADEPEAIADRAEALLAAIPSGEYEGAPVEASQAALEAIERLDKMQHRQTSAGLMTGLVNLDNGIGGFFGGELIVLASRPGVGKTSLATQIAYHSASRGRRTLIVSLEMSRVELVTRIACSLCGVSSHRVRCCKISTNEASALGDAMNTVANSALTIYDASNLGVPAIRRAARRLVRRGLSLVVIDYLALVAPQDRRVQRYQQLGEITAALKALARELDVPVLVLAQLSRESEKADRPTLAHLRESGNIEQDADVVLLLSRPEKGFGGGSEQDTWAAELACAKNRNGEVGTFRLDWQPETTTFAPHKLFSHSEFDGFR